MRSLIGLLLLVTISCQHAAVILTEATTVERDRNGIFQLKQDNLSCTAFHIGRGILISAAHCSETETKEKPVSATAYNGTKFLPVILAKDADMDLLVMQIGDSGFPVLDISLPEKGSISESKEADPTITIGYPGYFSPNFTFDTGYFKGLVNRKGRTLVILQDSVAQGYSGGPVINVRTGLVIGVQHVMTNLISKLEKDDPAYFQSRWIGLAGSTQDLVRFLESKKIEYKTKQEK